MISALFFMLIVSVLGTMPAWPYSRTWGYYPACVAALAFGTLILLAVSGRL